MTPERWQQIDRIFHAVLQRDPSQRSAFVAESCGGDPALQKEIEDLLASHEESDSFIETPASDVAAELLAEGQAGLVVGQAIGPYTVLDLIGAGGMGQVYLGTDTRLGRRVALKILPKQFTINPERVRRFEQEARAASALNHPNIVTIHEIGRSNSTQFIVTEFVDGQTLRTLMNEKPFTPKEALNVATQIAGALAAAHAAGIVHRDIKPENIMLRADGYVKILDFGLAKLTELPTTDSELEKSTLLQSNPGLVMGTVQYMSPEQARGKKVDARTDIWSLGIVLYELVSGRVPFTGETPSHVMVSLMENELPSLTGHATVPAELERIITKALRKDKKERYQTAKELAHDLKNLKQELQIEARLKRTPEADAASKERTTSSDAQKPVGSARPAAARTVDMGVAHPTSSAEYLVGEIKRHKRSAVFASVILILAVAAIAYFSYFRGAAGGETIDSVAVLPFVNVSNDANTEYLSDGLSDSIIDSLSHLPNLKKVIALSSVLRYKGKQTDPEAVGRELNVQAVLMGRITQHGDDLLISTELVDVKDNRRLWGGQYNRKLGDVLKLQGEIAQEITDRLRLKLTSEEKQRLAKRSTDNPEAYQLYLLGRFYRNQRANQKAIDYLEQAIKKDPNYAPAYAQLAYTYASASASDWFPRKEAREKMESAARRALELDDTLGDAHFVLAFTIDDRSAKDKEIQRALELDPNSADVHAFYARGLWASRRFDEAILHMKRAVELDPLSPALHTDLGKILYSAGQHDQAMEQYRKALELNPNYFGAHHHLANSYLEEGRYEEAIAETEKMSANATSAGSGRPFLGYTYAVAGKRAEAEKILAELKERSKQRHVNPAEFALIYTGLCDKDRAFEFLQKEYEENQRLPTLINVLPEWDSLRSDPRFTDLLRRMKFTE